MNYLSSIYKINPKINFNNYRYIRYYSQLGPQLPKCNFNAKNNKPKLSATDIESIHKLNLNPCLKPWYRKPVVIKQGYMQYVWDNDNKRYLDMFGGIVTTSIGHCHPKLVEETTKQLSKLWHTSSIYYNEEIHEYAKALAEKLPDSLNNIFFCNSGSEANDIAILMARLYTKSYDIISLRNAYHGDSLSTQPLCGVQSWKFPIPLHFGVHHSTNADPYSGRYGGSNCRDSIVQTTRHCECALNECNACDRYIEDFQQLFDSTLPKKICGFIAESIQGVGGVVQFPKDFLKRAYHLVRQRHGVCIADEVQTGFGRTGTHFWGFEGHGVVPDIVTMAKSIGNGFPLAAVATTSEIAKTLTEASYFNTFGGNPLASCVGLNVLKIIEDENLQNNSHKMGTKLLRDLQKLRDNYPDIVGDVRGKGLMIGVELTSDTKLRKPMIKSDFDEILENCRDMGLLIGRGGPNGNVFRVKPPMCINEEDIDFTINVLQKAFDLHKEKIVKKQ
ncbi:alanine--glyoxylate aminotransferase 2, mitochondrial-like [Oppia nitens]|uniref:alanine--glyoxylate aminotransferase 2, mitochondrial-like n=1 Tax=Oppia nitens TaxID=1686743 RepID=UPI0023DCE866|nr:alanine--glyoxylate aminotransferase 2, mitochondrial-like [Oppia nitens]